MINFAPSLVGDIHRIEDADGFPNVHRPGFWVERGIRSKQDVILAKEVNRMLAQLP